MKQKKLYFGLILLYLIILFVPGKIMANVEVYLDPRYNQTPQTDINLADIINDPNFSKPGENSIPVLFVHGNKLGGIQGPNYKNNWQKPLSQIRYYLPSFKIALDYIDASGFGIDNSHLNIEPYYIHLSQGENKTIQEDAGEIKEAIELILKRHFNPDYTTGDDVPAKNRIVIIACSKGTISTRYYLKEYMPRTDKSKYTVSEFIAICPPNHGLRSTEAFINGDCGEKNISLKQLNNGYDENGNSFGDKLSLDFIEKLNEHSICDTWDGNNGQHCNKTNIKRCNGDICEFPEEAPYSRHYGEPRENGILYVTLYARDNRDIVGGHTLSDDCMGRVLARNLAPNAVNMQIPGKVGGEKIPDCPYRYNCPLPSCFDGLDISLEVGRKIWVHGNIVHFPEVICKALYTAAYHLAPPDDLSYTSKTIQVDIDGSKESVEIPIIPKPPCVVLLFDTSGSMAWKYDGTRKDVAKEEQRLTLAKKAASAFIDLMDAHNPGNVKLGIASFQDLSGNLKECRGEKKLDLIPLKDSSTIIKDKINTSLEADGTTPLLGGLSTALEMFNPNNETTAKTIILLTDGYHNCPTVLKTENALDNKIIEDLENKLITVHTIGFGRKIEINSPFLDGLSGKTTGEYYDVTDLGYTPNTQWNPDVSDPKDTLVKTYTEILNKILSLNMAIDPTGIIEAGHSVTRKVKINKFDRKISFFLSWATTQKDRLGLKITAPDNPGNPISGKGIGSREGTTYKIITVDKPFLQHPGKDRTGTWKIEIDAGDLEDKKKENYQYSVIMDSDLKMKTTFDESSYKTGDTITITVKITEPGRRVKGLKNVKVTVTRPGDGIGNWYAANKITDDNLASIPDKIGDENISRLHRKAIFLTEKSKIALPIRTGPKTFCLHDDGCIGDKKKGDGIYTFRYNDTIKEGTYSFYVQATSNKKSANPFDREEMIQKYITVNAVSGYSGVNVTLKDTFKGDNNILRYLYDVTFTPRDRFGNYMRPGYRAYAKVVYNEGSNDPILLRDNLDGTYSNQLTLLQTDIDKGAKLAIAFDGKPIFTDKALPGAGHWSLSMHSGFTFPRGTLRNIYNRSLFLGFDLNYRLSPRFSLVGFFGYNRFKSALPSIEDTYWMNISLNMKYGFTTKPIRPYINTGPGIYIPKTGALRPGFNVGLGIDFPLSSGLIMELGTDYHHIFYSGIDTKFLTGHAGLILRL